MTKHEGMTNDQMAKDRDLVFSSFGLCASFGIRHSRFVISLGRRICVSSEPPVHTNGD
jgi:hypothetical protein